MIRRHFLLVSASLLAISACGDDGTGSSDIEGRYELRTVNGNNLPANATMSGITASVQSGHLQLSDGGTFTGALTLGITFAGQTQTSTQTLAGTWTRNGNTLTFTFPDGSSDTATLDGNQISYSNEGNVLVFRR